MKYDFRNHLIFPCEFEFNSAKIKFRELNWGEQDYYIRKHSHSFYETVFFKEGGGKFYYFNENSKKEESIEFSKGTLIETSPHIIHRYIPIKKCKIIYWTWEKQEFLENSTKSYSCHNIYDKIMPYIKLLYEESQNINSNTKIILQNLFESFHKSHQPLLNPNCLKQSSDKFLKNIPEYDISLEISQFIKDNYKEDISLETLSLYFSMSSRNIIRILRKKNSTFKKILNKERIKFAKIMVKTEKSKPLSYIARECGFNDEYYFAKVFKNSVGLAPGKYRNHDVK